MARKNLLRIARRSSRPHPDRFLTVMVVLVRHTFRWTLTRRTLFWILGTAAGLWAVAMIGSAYGLWASKKIMSFSALQRETAAQQQQLNESLAQAQGLEEELAGLRQQVSDLLKLLGTKSGSPDLPPAPGLSKDRPEGQQKVSQLKVDLEKYQDQARAIRQRMEPIIARWSRTPSILPTAGTLSSGFGLRISPFSRANEADDGLLGYHTGLDISNAENTPIQATANGTVVSAGWAGRYGNQVIIQHGAGLETMYAHLHRIHVREGQEVQRGEIIGAMGRTGSATGVHLHYEVRLHGRPVNPKPYLRLQRQWLSGIK